MTSPRWLRQKSTRIWLGFALAAVVAARLYYVREMVAALLLFSIGFGLMAAATLVLFLLDRAISRAVKVSRPHAAHATQMAQRRWSQIEQFGRKQLHRSQQPVEH